MNNNENFMMSDRTEFYYLLKHGRTDEAMAK